MTAATNGFLVLGYFDRHNLGDDIFLEVWKRLMADNRVDAVFASLEDCPHEVARAWRASADGKMPAGVIVAGGDVLTEYFTLRLRRVMAALGCQRTPIFGVSVAAPFESTVHLGLCDAYSGLLVRPSAHVQLLKSRLGERFVLPVQDLSCFLLRYGKQTSSSPQRNSKVLGVCMAAQVCGVGTQHYQRNVDGLARGILRACNGGRFTEVRFVPFDTSGAACGDDRVVIADIITAMKKLPEDQVRTVVQDALGVFPTFEDFCSGRYSVLLCCRYHSHMLAIMSGTPIASICATQKVRSLMKEVEDLHSLPCTYTPEVDEHDVPTGFDPDAIASAVQYANDRSVSLRCMLQSWRSSVISTDLPAMEHHIGAILRSPAPRPGAVDICSLRTVSERAEDCLLRLLRYLESKGLIQEDPIDMLPCFRDGKTSIDQLLSGGEREELATFLSSVACVLLTHDMYPPFHYGLSQKILKTTSLLADLQYMICTHDTNIGRKRAEVALPVDDNLSLVQKRYYCPGIRRASVWGIHRAGWEYVLRHLWHAHADDPRLPIFDDYVDSTFTWMSDALAAGQVIPYRRPWFGCLHHTANTESGPNNLETVFQNPLFIRSLQTCKYLIAMSRALATDVQRRLRLAGMGHVQVREMVHPSEFPTERFNIQAFRANPQRMLVQIGCWYRNPYTLYTLDLPDKGWIRKAALRGRRMHNNFPPSGLQLNATSGDPPMDMGVCLGDSTGDAPVQISSSEASCVAKQDVYMCRPDGVHNGFVMHMLRSIARDVQSVQVLRHLDNDAYDKLLSQNIVFLHMLDASAINTLIECVLRDTPVLVNRLPAVEQVLGRDYPMYFSDRTTAAQLACSPDVIRRAHDHMHSLDKRPFRIESFLQAFDANLKMAGF